MKNSVKDVGEEFLPESQTMGLVAKCRYFGAYHDFPVGEGEDIGGGRIGKVGVVQASAFAGRNEDDAQFLRQAALTLGR